MLATSSNHWVPRRAKKENGTRPEVGGGRKRDEARQEKSRPLRKRRTCAEKDRDRDRDTTLQPTERRISFLRGWRVAKIRRIRLLMKHDRRTISGQSGKLYEHVDCLMWVCNFRLKRDKSMYEWFLVFVTVTRLFNIDRFCLMRNVRLYNMIRYCWILILRGCR